MTIEFSCPNTVFDAQSDSRKRCGKKLRAPEGKAGVEVTCPTCGQPLTVPAASSSVDSGDRKSEREVKSPVKNRSNNSGSPKSSEDPELDGIKLKPAGFQLWISDIISEGVSVVLLTSMMHFVFALIAICLGALICFTSQGLGLVALFGLLFVAVFLYVALVYKFYDLARNPHARLTWFQRPVWDLVLWSARRSGWQSPSKRVVIDRRGKPVTDEGLNEIEDLGVAGVLDLEGTQVTDGAFRLFRRMKRLECLVLKGTDVSHAEVVRLQQSKPKLWIWY